MVNEKNLEALIKVVINRAKIKVRFTFMFTLKVLIIWLVLVSMNFLDTML